MKPVLSPPITDDPRPHLTMPHVISACFAEALPDVMKWASERFPRVTLDEAQFAIETAVRSAGYDAFRIGVVLYGHFEWPVNMALTSILNGACERTATALRITTTAWVLRNSVRVPAREKDLIGWWKNDRPIVGTVLAIDKERAQALVLPAGVMSNSAYRINAEDIYANMATGQDATHARHTPFKTDRVRSVRARFDNVENFTGFPKVVK